MSEGGRGGWLQTQAPPRVPPPSPRLPPQQVGADSVVQGLASKGLSIAGVAAPAGAVLSGTPGEPYANPTHLSAVPGVRPKGGGGGQTERIGMARMGSFLVGRLGCCKC